MRRREFIVGVAGASAWPVVARAQQSGRMPRVGVLMGWIENEPEFRSWLAAFITELARLGWVDGRNVRLDVRWTNNDNDRTRILAEELVLLRPDVILVGTNSATAAVHRETLTIPIVFSPVADPIASGFVVGLPRPGGNLTGFTNGEPAMGGNRFYLWIGQHETGRYSKAHKHASAAVLVCIKGKGYTYTWPEALGTTPWQDGKADKVLRQDYEPVGLVSAAPMSGDWFHQHFGVGREGLRITAWHGPNNQRSRKPGRPGEQLMDYGAIDLNKGGSAIPYSQEDPRIRREFEETLRREGVAARMDEQFYQASSDADSEPPQLM